MSAFLLPSGLLDRIRYKWSEARRAPGLLAAPAQAKARAHQDESCRTEDVTSAGEDRLTPM